MNCFSLHLIKHFEGTKNQDIYRKIFRFRGRRKNVLEISQYYLNRIKKDLFFLDAVFSKK